MKTDHLVKGLLAALLVALAVWVGMNTEWTEVDVRTPAKGEAFTNELYATQQLLRQLGAKVVKPEGLAQLPPRDATLFLSSWHWDLFPQRERLLRAWVQQGGHLVLNAEMLSSERLQSWLPIHQVEEHEEEDENDESSADKAASAPAKPRAAAAGHPEEACERVAESEGVRPHEGVYRQLCGGHGYLRVQSKQAPQWSVEGRRGYDLIRVAVGQGSVTVFTPRGLFTNRLVLKGDNDWLAMAALQVRRGGEVWFVSEEARQPLLAWVWTNAWVTVLLGLLALCAALWRGAVRFGPLAAQAVPGRRSMVEQVTGTAQFLRQRGADALHAAQVRALDEAAKSHLRDYARMDRNARAQAIAKVTGIDAPLLSRALDRTLKRSGRELPPTLEVLETARRRIKASKKSSR